MLIIGRELSFEVGDFVYPNVSPMRGLHRFKVRSLSTGIASAVIRCAQCVAHLATEEMSMCTIRANIDGRLGCQ
jgi:hypothetical protein